MVKRFGIVRTLNERLSRDSIVIDTNNNTHNDDSEDPPVGLGASSSRIAHQNELLSDKVVFLTEQLVDCRSCLLKTQKDLESLHFIKEQQFKCLVSQLLAFESGLRRKQRELTLAISQRDRLIREQSHIIRFLAGKSGLEGGSGSIQELRNEALAKIPVLHEEEGEMQEERRSGLALRTEEEEDNESRHSSKKLSCIIETGSEHDSDSAIILDDSSGSPSSAKRISRSVSDVVTKEEDDDDEEDDDEDEEEESHLLEGSLDSLLHTKQLLSSPNKKVTKPRDLKNKNHLRKSSFSDLSTVSGALSTTPSFSVHQHNTTKISRDNETGSVICSIFNHDEDDDDDDNESEVDIDGNVSKKQINATTSSFA